MSKKFGKHTISGMTVLEVLVIGTVLSIAVAVVYKPIENLGSWQKSTSQQIDFDHLIAEIKHTLLDPAHCAVALEESTPHSVKFCSGQGVDTRIVKDLGASGASAEDQILVPLESDATAGSPGDPLQAPARLGTIRVESENARARVLNCQDSADVPGQKRAKLEIKIPADTEAHTSLKAKTLNLLLNYQPLGGQFINCTLEADTGVSGASLGEQVCTQALGGTWDESQTPDCQLGVSTSNAGFANITSLTEPASGGSNRSLQSTVYGTAVSPTDPMHHAQCDYRVALTGPKFEYVIETPFAKSHISSLGTGKTLSVRGRNSTFFKSTTAASSAGFADPVLNSLATQAGIEVLRSPRLDLKNSGDAALGPLATALSSDYHSNLTAGSAAYTPLDHEPLYTSTSSKLEYRCRTDTIFIPPNLCAKYDPLVWGPSLLDQLSYSLSCNAGSLVADFSAAVPRCCYYTNANPNVKICRDELWGCENTTDRTCFGGTDCPL